MKLQDKLDAMREDFENGRFPMVPTSDQLDTMQRATQSLVDSGQADHALKAGDTAPELRLKMRRATAWVRVRYWRGDR